MQSVPPIPPEIALEMVGASHGQFERVKELLAAHPNLVNAAVDWGGGDWETALGAAAHMGRRDIALYLLERGARLDLFAAAMLGWLDVVKAMLAADPKAREFPGPHGIPLIVHAEHGGDAATPVADYLKSLA